MSYDATTPTRTLHLVLSIDGNSFALDGAVLPTADIIALVSAWQATIEHVLPDTLCALAGQLAESTADLVAAIAEQTGWSPDNTVHALLKESAAMPAADLLSALAAQVARTTTVMASGATLIRGIHARLAAAVAAAIANGATAEELAPVTDEIAALGSGVDDLSAAIAENTDAQVPEVPPAS